MQLQGHMGEGCLVIGRASAIHNSAAWWAMPPSDLPRGGQGSRPSRALRSEHPDRERPRCSIGHDHPFTRRNIPRVEFLRRHSVQAIERSSERSSDRPIDRAIERPSDRASDRATERPNEPATERPRDRATERPSDRATE